MHLSVIVPVFNEENVLEDNILLYKSYLDKQSFSYEILIVDDGSNDLSDIIIKKLANLYPNIYYLAHAKNQGKGMAIRSGMLKATGNYRLFLDADNATSIEHLDAVWTHLSNGADIVIGSRNNKDIDGAKQVVPQKLIKRISGILGNMLIRLLAIDNLYDTQCGFKIFKARAAQVIFSRCSINRWAIDIEILLIAKLHRLKIAIIPIRWVNNPQSRVKIGGYFITLKELFKIKYNYYKQKYH